MMTSRLFFTLSGGNSTSTTTEKTNMSSETQGEKYRKELLREYLLELGMDADGLEEAVQFTATKGYDGRFGKSVIKTCRSFWKNEHLQNSSTDLRAAALRTAHQVQFLYKRHESHKAEWIRHQDNAQKSSITVQKFPLILVLDNLRSANNVGSLFRTADAAGCTLILTVGITPHPNGNGAEKLQKTAKGAEVTVPSQHFSSLKAAIDHLNNKFPHYQILGVETTEKSVAYTDFGFANAVALVLGNEVTGVDATFLPHLDGIVEIPMFGIKNSLNVAVCAPIILYEIHRQWKANSNVVQ